jgi:hypothetical protein
VCINEFPHTCLHFVGSTTTTYNLLAIFIHVITENKVNIFLCTLKQETAYLHSQAIAHYSNFMCHRTNYVYGHKKKNFKSAEAVIDLVLSVLTPTAQSS